MSDPPPSVPDTAWPSGQSRPLVDWRVDSYQVRRSVMIVDCTTCPVRGQRCDDCVVTVLLTPRSPVLTMAYPPAYPPANPLATPPDTPLVPGELRLDAAESSAVSRLVGAGLLKAGAVPGLRARLDSFEPARSVRSAG